jgi:hypothetical protein
MGGKDKKRMQNFGVQTPWKKITKWVENIKANFTKICCENGSDETG